MIKKIMGMRIIRVRGRGMGERRLFESWEFDFFFFYCFDIFDDIYGN